jgi:hypothetical protein
MFLRIENPRHERCASGGTIRVGRPEGRLQKGPVDAPRQRRQRVLHVHDLIAARLGTNPFPPPSRRSRVRIRIIPSRLDSICKQSRPKGEIWQDSILAQSKFARLLGGCKSQATSESPAVQGESSTRLGAFRHASRRFPGYLLAGESPPSAAFIGWRRWILRRILLYLILRLLVGRGRNNGRFGSADGSVAREEHKRSQAAAER